MSLKQRIWKPLWLTHINTPDALQEDHSHILNNHPTECKHLQTLPVRPLHTVPSGDGQNLWGKDETISMTWISLIPLTKSLEGPKAQNQPKDQKSDNNQLRTHYRTLPLKKKNRTKKNKKKNKRKTTTHLTSQNRNKRPPPQTNDSLPPTRWKGLRPCVAAWVSNLRSPEGRGGPAQPPSSDRLVVSWKADLEKAHKKGWCCSKACLVLVCLICSFRKGSFKKLLFWRCI